MQGEADLSCSRTSCHRRWLCVIPDASDVETWRSASLTMAVADIASDIGVAELIPCSLFDCMS